MILTPPVARAAARSDTKATEVAPFIVRRLLWSTSDNKRKEWIERYGRGASSKWAAMCISIVETSNRMNGANIKKT